MHAFIPHAGNQYRPHALHPRRTVGYAISFLAMKGVLLALVAALPLGIFAAPEAVEIQAQELAALVDRTRIDSGLPPLYTDARLARSATAKTKDMIERQYFAHVNADSNGPEFFAAQEHYPYSIVGENLAMGFASASAVLDAWKQSPTHARNLSDPLFADAGLGIMSGTFRGAPTIFITQHLGRPRSAPPIPSAPTDTVAVPTTPTNIVRAASVEWRPRGRKTEVIATAHLTDTVAKPEVTIRGTTIPLERTAPTSDEYTGRAVLPESPKQVFRVVVPPTLAATTATGTAVTQPIPWSNPAVIRPSFVEKYTQATTLLPTTLRPLQTWTRALFGVGLSIFALAWVLNCIVEIRRQHLDLLIPGGALVLLLAALWMF